MINFRRIIYRLKRLYGAEIELYKENEPILNVETGRSITPREKFTVKRAIVMPEASQYNNPLITSIARLSGQTITATRIIIIDPHDISESPTEDWYLHYRDERYEIAKVEQIDRGRKIHGYQLTVRRAAKELSFFITDYIYNDYLIFADVLADHPPIDRNINDDLILEDLLHYLAPIDFEVDDLINLEDSYETQ